MARKSPSRLDKRREVEAAEKLEAAEGKPAKKKKATRKKAAKRTSRAKVKTPERREMLWGVFSGSMKEEARFPYHDRAAAEAKIEQLRARSKKPFFIQPIKEVITDPLPESAVEVE